jgi:hypothetical protein
MTLRTKVGIAAVAGGIVTLAVAGAVRAGPELIVFPENYAQGVLYATVDRPDNKQFRELYANNRAAIDAAKKSQPLPSGTVLTMVQYAAKLDAQGNPEKDANGRFIKTNIVGYTVMEKRTGWGAEYPETKRNGEWEYRAFRVDKTPNTQANLDNCFNCHKPLPPGQDFVFSYERMKAAP